MNNNRFPCATFVRPWPVLCAQLKALVLCWGSGFPRIYTYTESEHIGPFLWRVHYLRIELENGRVVYRTHKLPTEVADSRVRRIRVYSERVVRRFRRL